MKNFASDHFIDRIINSYRIVSSDFSNEKGDIWKAIDGLRAPIHDALINSDRSTIRNMLLDPVTTDLFYGMDNLSFSLVGKDDAATEESDDGTYAKAVEEQLYLLGEAFGARRTVREVSKEYFYMNNPSSALEDNVDVILAEIQKICGFDITFPAAFNREKGKLTKYGLCSFRSVAALYQAYRAKQEAGSKFGAKLLEIGPGMGRTIYYAHKAGMRCTTVDLPLGIVAQACFLAYNVGQDAIWLPGDSFGENNRIRLLSASTLHSMTEHFDLTLNADSLTEMDYDDALACIAWISGHCRTFLSINHDCNKFCVNDIIKSCIDPDYHARFNYRFLTGHTEEIVRMKQSNMPESSAEDKMSGHFSSNFKSIVQMIFKGYRGRFTPS